MQSRHGHVPLRDAVIQPTIDPIQRNLKCNNCRRISDNLRTSPNVSKRTQTLSAAKRETSSMRDAKAYAPTLLKEWIGWNPICRKPRARLPATGSHCAKKSNRIASSLGRDSGNAKRPTKL